MTLSEVLIKNKPKKSKFLRVKNHESYLRWIDKDTYKQLKDIRGNAVGQLETKEESSPPTNKSRLKRRNRILVMWFAGRDGINR